MMTEADRIRGQWAVVAYREASVGAGWFLHRIASVTRWVDLQHARREAGRRSGHDRKAVIPWNDDLLIGGHLGSAPELAMVPRVVAGLALDHEPLFEATSDQPDAMPTGRYVGCQCGWQLPAPLAWKDHRALFFAHTCPRHQVFQCTGCRRHFCTTCHRPTTCPYGTEELKTIGNWFCHAPTCVEVAAGVPHCRPPTAWPSRDACIIAAHAPVVGDRGELVGCSCGWKPPRSYGPGDTPRDPEDALADHVAHYLARGL